MNRELVARLACPVCLDTIEVESCRTVFEIRGNDHIDEGTLVCSSGHRFPIISEVPRLVSPELFSREEREALKRPEAQTPRCITPASVKETVAVDRIRESVWAQYDKTNSASAARGLSHATYLAAEYEGTNKRKYVRLLTGLGVRPTTILDVGGSLPGFLRRLSGEFQPRLAVVADLAIEHADAFKSPDRAIDLVRANAECLPFKPQSFDLVVSAFLLEHVPHWKKGLASMTEVGNELLIAYGPNSWFPFELGHLNSPLAGTLPKPLAKYVAYAWLNALGDQRSLESIERIIDGMSYFSSRAFRRHCRYLGLEAVNVFTRLVDEVVNDAPADAKGLQKVIRSFPGLTRALAEILEATGFEPQVYHFLRRPMGSPGRVQGTGSKGLAAEDITHVARRDVAAERLANVDIHG